MKINNFQLMTELHCRHGENRENEDTCSVVEGVGNSKFQKYISHEITYLNVTIQCLVVYYIIWWYHLILQLFSTGTLLVFLLPVKLQDHKKIIITGGKYLNELKGFSNYRVLLVLVIKRIKTFNHLIHRRRFIYLCINGILWVSIFVSGASNRCAVRWQSTDSGIMKNNICDQSYF